MFIYNTKWSDWIKWFLPASTSNCCLFEGRSAESFGELPWLITGLLQIYLNWKTILWRLNYYVSISSLELYGSDIISIACGTYFLCRPRQWSELVHGCISTFFSLVSFCNISEECERLNYAFVKLSFCLWWEGSALWHLGSLNSPPALWMRNLVSTCRLSGLADIPSIFLTVLIMFEWKELRKVRGKEKDKKTPLQKSLLLLMVVTAAEFIKLHIVYLLLRLIQVSKLISGTAAVNLFFSFYALLLFFHTYNLCSGLGEFCLVNLYV